MLYRVWAGWDGKSIIVVLFPTLEFRVHSPGLGKTNGERLLANTLNRVSGSFIVAL